MTPEDFAALQVAANATLPTGRMATSEEMESYLSAQGLLVRRMRAELDTSLITPERLAADGWCLSPSGALWTIGPYHDASYPYMFFSQSDEGWFIRTGTFGLAVVSMGAVRTAVRLHQQRVAAQSRKS